MVIQINPNLEWSGQNRDSSAGAVLVSDIGYFIWFCRCKYYSSGLNFMFFNFISVVDYQQN